MKRPASISVGGRLRNPVIEPGQTFHQTKDAKKHRNKSVVNIAITFIFIAIVWWRLAKLPTTNVDSPPLEIRKNVQSLPTLSLNRNNSIMEGFHVDSFSSSFDQVKGNVSIISRSMQKCRKNAIVLLAQKKHGTYDRDSYGLLIKSLTLLSKNYLSRNNHFENTDLFLFHTGDFDASDLEYLEPIVSSNRTGMIKLVNLDGSAYWSLPKWHHKDDQKSWMFSEIFPLGYRHMCRWFGIKIWQFFEDLNDQLGCEYRYILRIDEDSFVLSPIQYDIFDFMKKKQFVYGYRLCAYEMDYNNYIFNWFRKWHARTNPNRPITPDLCGFYNNFFVADLHFFRSVPVRNYLTAMDRQGFVYRKRYGDLMLHTVAVYAFANANQIHRFLDFTYQHVTIDHILKPDQGCVVWGGIQAGYNDANAEQNLKKFYKSRVSDRQCPINMTIMEERDLSPSYQHIPPKWKGKVHLKTMVAGKVELPYQGILSG